MRYSFVLLVGYLFSCSTISKETVTDVPFAYENTSLKVESASGCTAERSCALFLVTYPQFSGLSPSVESKLRKEIELSVSMGDPEANDKTLKQIADEFVSNYNSFKMEFSESEQGWYYKANVSVNLLLDTLISLEVNEEYYTGGAHGGAGKSFINMNPKTGEAFTLDNMLKPGYQTKLSQLGEKAFRIARELADTASLKNNYFDFPEDKFALNQNYGFTSEGLVFFYNNYEIAPYAAGPTQVEIRYEEISDLIR